MQIAVTEEVRSGSECAVSGEFLLEVGRGETEALRMTHKDIWTKHWVCSGMGETWEIRVGVLDTYT